MMTYIINVFVYFISKHIQAFMTLDYFGESLKLCLRIYASGRIAWRAEYEHTCLGCNSSLKLLRSNLEVLLKTGIHDYRITTREFYHLRIAYPIRGRNYHLFSVVDKCHNGVAYALLGSVRHENLSCSIVEIVLVLEFSHDSLTQIHVSGNR